MITQIAITRVIRMKKIIDKAIFKRASVGILSNFIVIKVTLL